MFPDVRLVAPRAGEVNNRVLLAGERRLPAGVRSSAHGADTLDRARVARFARGAPVFTDDHAPADQLLDAP